MKEAVYTKEDLKGYLVNYIVDNNRVPTNREIKENKKMPSLSAYRRCGGVPELVEEMGFVYPHGKKYDGREVRSRLIARIKELKRMLTKREINKFNELPCYFTLYKMFYNREKGRWSDWIYKEVLKVKKKYKDFIAKSRRLKSVWENENGTWTAYMGDEYLGKFKTRTDANKARLEKEIEHTEKMLD